MSRSARPGMPRQTDLASVACVLRSGGVYGPAHVLALYRGVREHWPAGEPLDFVVLSDQPIRAGGIRTLPLEERWPGWWSKMELFRPGRFAGPVLYMDLDTLPVGDLSDLAALRAPLAMLRDFYASDRRQSGVLAWTPGPLTVELWQAWAADPVGHMRAFRGDGEWLHAMTARASVTLLQDVRPGQIVSFKVHARGGPPDGARLVCAHGQPKFESPAAGWAHPVWKARALT